MRRRLPILLAVFVALVVVLRFTLLRPEPVSVHVAPVEIARVEATVTNSKAGTIRARHRAKLSPEVGGRIAELLYREGDSVAAGGGSARNCLSCEGLGSSPTRSR